MMKKSFYASICANGLHGGAIYLVDNGFSFRCKKITIEDVYKNLYIPYNNIKSISTGNKILFIPTTVIQTIDEKTYRFLIFNRKEFKNCINKYLF